MLTPLTESRWKPIKRNDPAQKGYTINAYSSSTSWYNNYLDNGGSRINKLRRYDEADNTCVRISRALDILAEDISSSNADNDDIFFIQYKDDTKIKKTTLKMMDAALELWDSRKEISENFFDDVRNALKYGMTVYHLQSDGSYNRLLTEKFVGYIVSEEDENIITHYIYNPDGEEIPRPGCIYNQLRKREQNNKLVPISVDDLVILKTDNSPFGTSVIERVYRTWRQMSLIEDAVIIYRVVRAPERRIYYIDVGNLQGPRREAAIEKQRIKLMQKNSLKKNELTAEYDPFSTSEDIFIPTNSTGKGSRIETLPGGQNLGELADLEWFQRELAAGLRIPNSMLETQSDGQQNTFSDMRVGQLYQAELRYMGYVKRFQRKFETVLFKDFRNFCRKRDYVIHPDAKLRINESMSFHVYKEVEINQTLLNVYNSTLQMTSLSKKYGMQKYLNFTQEELADNEYNILIEKGLSPDQIKAMPEDEIQVIVYGKPKKEVLEKYGISDEVDGTGGRW